MEQAPYLFTAYEPLVELEELLGVTFAPVY